MQKLSSCHEIFCVNAVGWVSQESKSGRLSSVLMIRLTWTKKRIIWITGLYSAGGRDAVTLFQGIIVSVTHIFTFFYHLIMILWTHKLFFPVLAMKTKLVMSQSGNKTELNHVGIEVFLHRGMKSEIFEKQDGCVSDTVTLSLSVLWEVF